MRFNKDRQPLSQNGRKWLKTWSGREDSNLRPLPPEDDAPALIRLFSAPSDTMVGSYGDVCSHLFTAQGSNRTSNPCLRAYRQIGGA
jgi:hypothetical protein